MVTVDFCRSADVPEELYKFAVTAARYNGQWIFCRHRERLTYEVPGGHREAGESITQTARRELYEETGAFDYNLVPVTSYSVTANGETTYGKLFFAEVRALGELPRSEIAEIIFSSDLPKNLTYPQIQPSLFEKVKERLAEKVLI